MPRKEKVKGICHICGLNGDLTFEHVPPEKAFNNNQVYFTSIKSLMKSQQWQISQQGMGRYTLCGKCNSDTGSWYGTTFVEWCKNGMDILQKANLKPTLHYEYKTYPLRVVKQIITMFFSVNSPKFREQEPELRKLILNKFLKGLSNRYKFFIYYNFEGWCKQAGLSLRLDFDPQFIASPKPTFISESNYPPFGYVMTIDSDCPDNRLYDISYFSRYEYDELVYLYPKIPVLQSYTYLAGDYHTKKEIDEAKQELGKTQGLQAKLEDALNNIKARK